MSSVKIRYIVHDVEAAVEFYTQVLNFRVRMHPAPGFASLERGDLELLLNAPGAGGAGEAMPDGTVPEPGGWNRVQIRVDGLDDEVERLNGQGARFRNEIVTGKGGRQILLEDPSGNPIELFEPARRGAEPVPDGYHTVTPFLIAEDALGLIAFIEAAFGATIDYLMKSEDGHVRHAVVRIGDSPVMISSATPEYGPRTAMLHLYVDDVDRLYAQAIEAEAVSLREPTDEFYGDRSAGVKDDWGNTWWIATHVEDVSEEEMARRESDS